MDPDDVLVRNLAGEEELPLETPVELPRHGWIGGRLGSDYLERDRNVDLRIPRLVHRTHAAETEERIDTISLAKGSPDLERPPPPLPSSHPGAAESRVWSGSWSDG